MRLLLVPLLGWGMMVSAVDVPSSSPVVSKEAKADLYGDIDTRCSASLNAAGKAQLAEGAMARVLVVDQLEINRDLYTTIFHSGVAQKLFAALKSLASVDEATIRSHINNRTFDTYVEEAAPSGTVSENEKVFVYTVSNFEEAQSALEWAKREKLHFDLVVSAGLFPETPVVDSSFRQLPFAERLGAISTPANPRSLSDRHTPSGTPVFDLIETIRKADRRTRIVVCSNWEQRAVEEYAARLRYVEEQKNVPDEWYVLAVSPHLLLFELWKSVQSPTQP